MIMSHLHCIQVQVLRALGKQAPENEIASQDPLAKTWM
jgi:hypothetical protein